MKIVRKPEATVMTVTPEIAKAMLATSPGNRRMRGWYVTLLAAAMRRGEWRVTSQGIGFDTSGRLRDAHHRLSACIQSGVAFDSVVVYGLSDDAYEVIDTGMLRTYADRLGMDRAIADVLRLGCQYALGTAKPTIDQMRPIIDAGLGAAADGLVKFCGSKKRFYSSAPVKLAACLTILNGGNADFVLRQYRALCLLDFDSMTPSAQALVRQVDSGKIVVSGGEGTREALARGLRVFDEDRSNATRIVVSEADTDAAVEVARSVLRRSVTTHEVRRSRACA